MKIKLLQIGTAVIILSFFLVAPASAIIINGVPYNDGSVANPNQYYTPTTDLQTSSVTAGTNTNSQSSQSITPQFLNGRWAEETMRAYLGHYAVKEQNGVSVYGLGNFGVTGAVSLKKTVDYYTLAMRGTDRDLFDLNISGGTEIYGLDQPVLDVDSDDNLDYFIRHMATSRGGDLYQLGDDYFFDRNGSWHIIFGPSNGTFVKNSVNFFGVVRDNFNVAHPMITDTNIPASITFSRNLTIGYTGQDVHDLQQLLNTDPYTTIAQTGPGSRGAETSYYGNLTEKAVERWQYKYNEILDAAGVTAPTGFFGPFTRASMTAYWHYFRTLKTSPNQAALQYPTPTKPLEDVPLDADVTPTGDNASDDTTVDAPDVINNTPNAPVYPGSDQDPGSYNLNPTPAFYDPSGSYTTDPNSNLYSNQSANPGNSSTGQQQQGNQSPLSQLGQILALSRLFGGGTNPLGGGSSGGAGGKPDFGGRTLYNSLFSNNPYKPCGVSAVISLQVNSNSSAPSGIKPITLLQTPSSLLVSGSPPIGICVLGKYDPAGAAAVNSCITLVKMGQYDVPVPGMAGIMQSKDPLFMPYIGNPVSGSIVTLNINGNNCN